MGLNQVTSRIAIGFVPGLVVQGLEGGVQAVALFFVAQYSLTFLVGGKRVERFTNGHGVTRHVDAQVLQELTVRRNGPQAPHGSGGSSRDECRFIAKGGVHVAVCITATAPCISVEQEWRGEAVVLG